MAEELISQAMNSNESNLSLSWFAQDTKIKGVIHDLIKPWIDRYYLTRQLKEKEDIIKLQESLNQNIINIHYLESLIYKKDQKSIFIDEIENRITKNV